MHARAAQHRLGGRARREGHPTSGLIVRCAVLLPRLSRTDGACRKKERTLENLYAADVELTKEDLDKIAKIMETNPVRGDRAFGPQVEMRLWG